LHLFDIMEVEILTINENKYNKNSEWMEFGKGFIHILFVYSAYACCICGLGWSIGAMLTYFHTYGYLTTYFIYPGWYFFMNLISILVCSIGFIKYYPFKDLNLIFHEDTPKILKKIISMMGHGIMLASSLLIGIIPCIKSWLYFSNF